MSRRELLGAAGGAAAIGALGARAGAAPAAVGRPEEGIPLAPLARLLFRRYEAIHSFTHYQGILTLHSLARLALITEDEAALRQCRDLLLPFVRGGRKLRGNFANYECGGNATAYLHWQGKLPEARDAVRRHAEQLVTSAPRDAGGIFCHPGDPKRARIWIDVAFAVTPFLLFAGLALQEERWVEEALAQTGRMVAVFRDPANGLLHQSRGFAGPGKLSEDHWSRGNGWALLALAELVNYLPEGTGRSRATAIYTDLIEACLRCQDERGVWHQELTDPTSYVETSGTGLILYALGAGLERGLLPAGHREHFLRGLRGYLSYVAVDGSVHNTCQGCLCPGDGSVEAYKARGHILNDSHAFGPAILALGQAIRLGIEALPAV